MRVDRWAGGRAGVQASGRALVVSCHAPVPCRVRVFPVFGTPDSGIVTAFGLMAWHGHGVGMGMGRAGLARLQDPRALPKDCDTRHGERDVEA